MKNNNIFGMATPKRDFANIRFLIQVSMTRSSIEFDKYVAQLVHDAQLILKSPTNVSDIDRDLFFYSVYLGEKGGSWVPLLNPDHLEEDDYKKMLEVFEMP